jgi:hypothetical protein
VAIQREDMVEQSVQDYLREMLFDGQGYPEGQIGILDAFTAEEFEGDLDKNYIAVGFNFDDGGDEAECGSTLTRKVVTIEFFILGKTSTWGRNLKNALVTSFERDKRVPLRNIGDPAKPIFDYLPVLNVTGSREPIPDPAPWQRFVWTVLLRLEDEYQVAFA